MNDTVADHPVRHLPGEVTLVTIAPGPATAARAELRERAERMLSAALREDCPLDRSVVVAALAPTGELVGAQAADVLAGPAARELAARLDTLGVLDQPDLAADLAAALRAGLPVLRIGQLAVHPHWRGGTVRPQLRQACWDHGLAAGATLAYAECWLNGGDQSLPGAVRAGWSEFARVRGFWSAHPVVTRIGATPPECPAWQVDPQLRRCAICGPAQRCACGAALIVRTIPGAAAPATGESAPTAAATPTAGAATPHRFATAASVTGLVALVAGTVAACGGQADEQVMTCVDSTNHVIDAAYCGVAVKNHPAQVPANWDGHTALPSATATATTGAATSPAATPTPTASADAQPAPGAHPVYVPYNTWLASQRTAGRARGSHILWAAGNEPLGKVLTAEDVVNPKTGDTLADDGGKLTATGIADESGKGFSSAEGFDSSNGGHVSGGFGGEGEGAHGGFGGGGGGE